MFISKSYTPKNIDIEIMEPHFPKLKGEKSMENHVPSSIFMFKKCEFSPSSRCSGAKYACSPFQQGDVAVYRSKSFNLTEFLRNWRVEESIRYVYV